VLFALVPAAPALASQLLAGVGRADITPPTGYYLMGWVRSDAVGRGQHTRLYARAVVLQQDGRKVALVAEDVNGIPGGVLQTAGEQLKSFGFSEQNIIDSASHTHAGPSQFYNFPSYNTVFMTNSTLTQQNISGSIDPQLYAFEVHQLVTAIRRANANLGPARAAWGSTQLLGLTQNRSLEAHLANFDISEPYGTGSVNQDPGGYPDTIDPNVDVLRVDKLLPVTVPVRGSSPGRSCRRRHSRGRRRKLRCHNQPGRRRRERRRARTRPARQPAGRPARQPASRVTQRPSRRGQRRGQGQGQGQTPGAPGARTVLRDVPVGMWSTFSNHGTVNKSTFTFYNADHQGPAMRITEDAIRAQGGAPADQDVVNAFGNSDEGDTTAGLQHTGPAGAEEVGRQEANAMMIAWREAGQHLADSLPLEERWTRICFCGQDVTGLEVDPTGSHPIDSVAVFGVPQLTGSEEGRGPLYDNTHIPFEGDHLAFDAGPQGDKIQDVRSPPLNVPKAVPLAAVRIGDRLVVTIPGEMTVTMGQRLRKALLDASAAFGISRVVIAGLANEYLSYYTTPKEYEAQHYEGGSTLYGTYSSYLLMDQLADLTHRLLSGQPAPDPFAYDPTQGVTADASPFPPGDGHGTATGEPSSTPRLGHPAFHWTGGPRGLDRPVDAPFVTVQQLVGGEWKPVADDLGLQILWAADDQGHYQATWEVPRAASPGSYRFRVTANRYQLDSAPFAVQPTSALTIRQTRSPGDGTARLELAYPAAVPDQDITYRPGVADGGVLTANVGGQTVTVNAHAGTFVLAAPPGTPVQVAPGGAHDAYGNVNGNSLSFTA
jgi:hypothetical protein